MTPPVVPQTLSQPTFPVYAPPPVPNSPNQHIYNPFLHERKYIQAPLDNRKQWQRQMNFELQSLKEIMGLMRFLIGFKYLSKFIILLEFLLILTSRLPFLDFKTLFGGDSYAYNVNSWGNYKLLLGVIFEWD